MLFQFTSLEHLQRCPVCDPATIFFTSKFSYTLFCNPTHKPETGIANRWGTTNSKPTGLIIIMSTSEIMFITLFSAGAHHCCALYQPLQTVELCWAKTIFLSQAGMFVLFFVQFYCAGSHTEHHWRCSYNAIVIYSKFFQCIYWLCP